MIRDHPEPDRRASWHLGPFPVRAYALCILVGIVVAIWLGDRRLADARRPSRASSSTSPPGPCRSASSAAGSTTSSPTRQPTSARAATRATRFTIWEGGLGIWGAVALGARRRLDRLPPARRPRCRRFADALAPGIARSPRRIGRFGNWFNNELYGGPTTLPWGLEIYEWDTGGGSRRPRARRQPDRARDFHPTFLYESLWDLARRGVLILVDRRFKLGRGRVFALYVAGYPVGRGWIEALRIDPRTTSSGCGSTSGSRPRRPARRRALVLVAVVRPGRSRAERLRPASAGRATRWRGDRRRRRRRRGPDRTPDRRTRTRRPARCRTEDDDRRAGRRRRGRDAAGPAARTGDRATPADRDARAVTSGGATGLIRRHALRRTDPARSDVRDARLRHSSRARDAIPHRADAVPHLAASTAVTWRPTQEDAMRRSALPPVLRGARRRTGSTTPPPSTTPAASRSSRPCAARRATTSSSTRSTALRNLDHRGAAGADADTGDGAGILTQVPDAFLRAVVAFALPAGRRVRRRHRLPARRRRRAATRRGRRSSGSPPRRACASSAGATCRSRPTSSAPLARACHAAVPPALRRQRRGGARPAVVGMASSGMAFCLRKRAEREAGVYFASLSARTLVYKGMLTTGQLEPFFPDLSDRAVRHRARARALAVLDEHVPVLAARAPVPVHRAQRRDQHRARATATGCAPARASCAAT